MSFYGKPLKEAKLAEDVPYSIDLCEMVNRVSYFNNPLLHIIGDSTWIKELHQPSILFKEDVSCVIDNKDISIYGDDTFVSVAILEKVTSLLDWMERHLIINNFGGITCLYNSIKTHRFSAKDEKINKLMNKKWCDPSVFFYILKKIWENTESGEIDIILMNENFLKLITGSERFPVKANLHPIMNKYLYQYNGVVSYPFLVQSKWVPKGQIYFLNSHSIKISAIEGKSFRYIEEKSVKIKTGELRKEGRVEGLYTYSIGDEATNAVLSDIML